MKEIMTDDHSSTVHFRLASYLWHGHTAGNVFPVAGWAQCVDVQIVSTKVMSRYRAKPLSHTHTHTKKDSQNKIQPWAAGYTPH